MKSSVGDGAIAWQSYLLYNTSKDLPFHETEHFWGELYKNFIGIPQGAYNI